MEQPGLGFSVFCAGCHGLECLLALPFQEILDLTHEILDLTDEVGMEACAGESGELITSSYTILANSNKYCGEAGQIRVHVTGDHRRLTPASLERALQA